VGEGLKRARKAARATSSRDREVQRAGAPTRRSLFIRRLAEFLAGENQMRMSVLLQTGDARALEWRDIRALTPLFGYPTVDEAEKHLDAWFAQGMP